MSYGQWSFDQDFFIQHDNIWPLLDHMLSFYMDMQKVW